MKTAASQTSSESESQESIKLDHLQSGDDVINSARDNRLLTNNTETLMNLLKGNIGTGILALPIAFSNSGLTFGTVGLIVIMGICTHCMHQLLKSERILVYQYGVDWLDYPDVVKLAFKSGPQPLQKFSNFFGILTTVFMVTGELGYCCTYIFFVCENIHVIIEPKLTLKILMVIFIPLFIIENFVRSLKYLAIFSTIANFLQLICLIVIFYYIFDHFSWPDPSPPQIADVDKIPLWFGTVLYTAASIVLVLPTEKKMQQPNDLIGWKGILNVAMLISTVSFVSVGFFGYLKYGNKIKDSITLNLEPQTDVLPQLVKAGYGLAIFLTYPIIFYVPYNLIWPKISKKLTKNLKCPIQIAVRTGLVLFTFVLAFFVPHLDLAISLVGALTGSYLALIMPAVLESVVLFTYDRLTPIIFVKNIVIIVIGLLGLIAGTYVTIYDIVDTFSSSAVESR